MAYQVASVRLEGWQEMADDTREVMTEALGVAIVNVIQSNPRRWWPVDSGDSIRGFGWRTGERYVAITNRMFYAPYVNWKRTINGTTPNRNRLAVQRTIRTHWPTIRRLVPQLTVRFRAGIQPNNFSLRGAGSIVSVAFRPSPGAGARPAIRPAGRRHNLLGVSPFNVSMIQRLSEFEPEAHM